MRCLTAKFCKNVSDQWFHFTLDTLFCWDILWNWSHSQISSSHLYPHYQSHRQHHHEGWWSVVWSPKGWQSDVSLPQPERTRWTSPRIRAMTRLEVLNWLQMRWSPSALCWCHRHCLGYCHHCQSPLPQTWSPFPPAVVPWLLCHFRGKTRDSQSSSGG